MAVNQQPLFNRIRDIFSNGFSVDWISAIYVGVTHFVTLLGAPFAFYYAPAELTPVIIAWISVYFVFGAVSITAYCHRLITHQAAKDISLPVHLCFGFVGQVLAMQGHIIRWSSNHVLHHGADKSGKYLLDPYSATWFPKAWQNFIWSHTISHLINHPDSEEKERAIAAKEKIKILRLQRQLYVPLIVLWVYLTPFTVGYILTGSLAGALGLLAASLVGMILVQHNTWTVNSITHMWGFTQGLHSSAVNNYVWLGPLGEGNHHADHHDCQTDYRNGFGWTGWLLDPTRYVLLSLRGVGLVKGLRRASKHVESEIIARRRLRDLETKTSSTLWSLWEQKLVSAKADWLEKTRQWEQYRQQVKKLKKMSLPDFEFEQRINNLKAEIQLAKRNMKEARISFFETLSAYRQAAA
ncbi:MAG: stearoyl-CoA desaturase (delta-9 desaturase) [Oceanicoccus sp.]|jgi:stearoyl-CoA desaturase (delta-9 desaturase)